MSTSFVHNGNYRWWFFIPILALMICFIVAFPSQTDAQPEKARKPEINRQQYNVHRVFREADNDKLTPFNEESPDRCPPNPPPPEMDFYLAWTNFEMHRVNDDSQIQIILRGRVRTTENLCWRLTTAAPENGGPPHLYFVEDIFGSENGTDIPLTWEIKTKHGGEWGQWQNMTVNQDNSLTYVFPESNCRYRFRVRIRGNPVYHQADGHYRLELNQQLTPLL